VKSVLNICLCLYSLWSAANAVMQFTKIGLGFFEFAYSILSQSSSLEQFFFEREFGIENI